MVGSPNYEHMSRGWCVWRRTTELIQLTNHYPQHVVCAWMGNSETVAEKHYLQITDDHLKAGCGMKPDGQVVAQVVADPSLIAPHAPSAKTQTLQKEAFHVIDRHGPSVAFCA